MQFLFIEPFLFCALRDCRWDSRFWFLAEFRKLAFKDLKAAQFVEVLAPLVAADSGNACRPVHEPYAAFGLVLVLSALAARPEGLHVATSKKIFA